MTQAELAKRTKIAQPYLADIEAGKADVRLGTLRRIFQAMQCDLYARPEPTKRLEEVLRGRARAVALKRLKQSIGTMAMEGQAPDEEMFRRLLEKKTDEILEDKHERLWAGDDE
jgi:transcriptional regulator with XRE-family HTH domain